MERTTTLFLKIKEKISKHLYFSSELIKENLNPFKCSLRAVEMYLKVGAGPSDVLIRISGPSSLVDWLCSILPITKITAMK